MDSDFEILLFGNSGLLIHVFALEMYPVWKYGGFGLINHTYLTINLQAIKHMIDSANMCTVRVLWIHLLLTFEVTITVYRNLVRQA